MNTNIQNEPPHILLVEDSFEDIELTTEAMKANKFQTKLHVVTNGVDALKFLRKINGYGNVPTPNLIMLDLNMPRKDGREVLAEIKVDENLKHIPVIVLTTSKANKDVMASYKHHANCYIIKPVDFHSFEKIIRQVESFWFGTVNLPNFND